MKNFLQKSFLLSYIFACNSFMSLQGMLTLGRISSKKNPVLNCAVHNGVDLYRSEKDKHAVEKIALQNIYNLVSIPISFRECTLEEMRSIKDDALQNQILSALDDNTICSKVYREQDKTVGFITYSFKRSLGQRLFPQSIGSNVTIHHLAIDNTYKKKGYGSLLLQHVIEECKQQNVNTISLWTTAGSGLDKYYPRHGFTCVRETKLHEEQWLKRLQPHPMVIILHMMIHFLKNKK